MCICKSTIYFITLPCGSHLLYRETQSVGNPNQFVYPYISLVYPKNFSNVQSYLVDFYVTVNNEICLPSVVLLKFTPCIKKYRFKKIYLSSLKGL
jgi:hypothetical protein